MPLEERRQRHADNYRVLVRNDISHWAERFLATLESPTVVDLRGLSRAAKGL